MGVRKVSAVAAAACVLAVSGGASAATFTNGSFEDGVAFSAPYITIAGGDSTSITGWTVGGHSVDYIGTYWQAEDGNRSIDLAGNGNGTLFQTFDTVAGTTYNVGFWVGRNPDGGANPRTGFVDVGGAPIAVSYSGSGNRADMQWQQEAFSFVAGGPTTTLTFAADSATSGGFYGMALDNVSIAAVPEPAIWGMMLLGFGLVGGALRQRGAERTPRIRFA